MTLSVINFFIFYCILGITIFYSFFETNPLDSSGLKYKNGVNYYFKAFSLLVICEFIRLFIFRTIKQTPRIKFTHNNNPLIFLGLISLVIIALVFGIKRENLGDIYEPAITTFYELGYLYFLFSEKYSGSSRIKKLIISGLVFIYILQDL